MIVLATWEAAQTVALAVGVVGAVVALLGLWINGLRAERQRRREFYAEALEATFAYREFAYVVRRRRHDAASDERIRISEALRIIQRDLAKYQAFMRIERCTKVAKAYETLVAETRSVAGGYIHDAWKQPPAATDEQMNIPDVDYTPLDAPEKAYLDAVSDDLAWWRFWR